LKWLDYGQIFNTSEYEIEYAKSPQALVFDDFVRIYFSACRPDNGKLISYVCFIDIDKDFQKIQKFSNNVLSDGKLGCYDEHGIFPFSPLKVDGEVRAYISGISRRVSVSVDSGIGLAYSKDNGDTFTRFGDGPILTTSLNEPFLVIDGFVRHYNGNFNMWYIFGTRWKTFIEGESPERIYRIGHAVSNDGIEWIKSNKEIIPNRSENEAQALPSVIKWNNRFHMAFCFRNAFDFRTNNRNSYRLGYAFSNDMIHWERNDEFAFKGTEPWASEMICYPNLFECDDKLYLLYNGNQFGRHGFGLAQYLQ